MASDLLEWEQQAYEHFFQHGEKVPFWGVPILLISPRRAALRKRYNLRAEWCAVASTYELLVESCSAKKQNSNKLKKMKKTLSVLLAAACMSQAATDAIMWASTNAADLGADILTVSGTSLPYIGVGGSRMNAEIFTSNVTTEGNTSYNLKLNDPNYLNDVASFSVNTALFFNAVDGDKAAVKQVIIDFGTEGAITTQAQFNIGQGVRKTQRTDAVGFTVAATVTDEQLADYAGGEQYVRTLVSAGEFWNVRDSDMALTLTMNAPDGYALGGVAYFYTTDGKYYTAEQFWGPKSESITFEAGKYYLLDEGSKLNLVVVKSIPEPATATLSLLALAGLAARRRRH